MGKACGTVGRREECVQGFGGRGSERKNHLEDLVVDGRIILILILKWAWRSWA
jgi:hypothetical protein